MDLFDFNDYKGKNNKSAFEKLQLDRALILGARSDMLFPLKQQKHIADQLISVGTDTRFITLDSPQGHDAFLTDIDQFGPPIQCFLSDI